jgi:hypothetical protein
MGVPVRSKLEIYALSVCFASVVCLVISFGIAGYSIVEIFKPELTMSSYSYANYQTNDSYWKYKHSQSSDEKDPRPSEEALSKQRLEEYSIELKGEERGGFQVLIKSLMFILVGSISLLIHAQIAKKSRGA